MKKLILIIFVIFFSTASSFGVDCGYKFKIKNKEYCEFFGDWYNLKSYKFDKKTSTYSINMLYDLLSSDNHQTYKVPNDKNYIAYLIFRTYYKDKQIKVECIGYITGDLKVFYHEDGTPEYADYVDTKIYMKRPKTGIDIEYFEKLYFDYLNKHKFIEVIESMASNQKD